MAWLAEGRPRPHDRRGDPDRVERRGEDDPLDEDDEQDDRSYPGDEGGFEADIPPEEDSREEDMYGKLSENLYDEEDLFEEEDMYEDWDDPQTPDEDERDQAARRAGQPRSMKRHLWHRERQRRAEPARAYAP